MTGAELATFIVGILIPLAGIVLVFVYVQRPKPVFMIVGNRVVGESSDDRIEIRFAGDKVPRVTRSRISFWNAGRPTLRGSDVVGGNAVTFRVEDGAEVLAHHQVFAVEETNGFELCLLEDGRSIEVTFDYMERNQGVVFDVLHTGSHWQMTATGKVIGVPKGLLKAGAPGGRPGTRRLLFHCMNGLAVGGLVVGLAPFFKNNPWFIVGGGTIVLVSFIGLYFWLFFSNEVITPREIHKAILADPDSGEAKAIVLK